MSYTYKFLLDENGQVVYPRTVLSAVDVITANGIQISGDTMSIVFASKEQIHQGAAGMVISAEGLKEAISAYSDTLYIAGGGIDIKGGTVFAKPAPVNSLIMGTPNEEDSVTNGNLNGALDAGKAVDVTALPAGVVYGHAWTSVTEYTEVVSGENITENCIRLQATSASSYSCYGWDPLPNFIPGSVYLLMADVKAVTGSVRRQIGCNASGHNFLIYDNDGNPYGREDLDGTATSPFLTSEWKRLAICVDVKTPAVGIWFHNSSASALDIRIKHFKVFDVTNLSMEAKYALASMKHPERVYDRYLIKKDEVCPWVEIRDLGSATNVSLDVGKAYELIATDGNTHVLNTTTTLENAYGKDTYITITLDDRSNIASTLPLVIMDPLIPNAVNHCVVKFRDGYARLYLENTDGGYIVVVNTGTTEGSLYYALTNNYEYINFAATTEGAPISTMGAVSVTKPKNIVGRGTEETMIDLQQNHLTINSSVTLRDVTIQHGSAAQGGIAYLSGNNASLKATNCIISSNSADNCGIWQYGNQEVAFINCAIVNNSATNNTILGCNSGTIRISNSIISGNSSTDTILGFYNSNNVEIKDSLIENNKGNGLIISAANNTVSVSGTTMRDNITSTSGGHIKQNYGTLILTDCKFENGSGAIGGAIQAYAGTLNATNCYFLNNSAKTNAGAVFLGQGSLTAIFSSCTFEGNTSVGGAIMPHTHNKTKFIDCYFGDGQDIYLIAGATVNFTGSNHLKDAVRHYSSGFVYIEDGAIVDLSGNPNHVVSGISPYKRNAIGVGYARTTIGNNTRLITSGGIMILPPSGTVTAISNKAELDLTSCPTMLVSNQIISGVTIQNYNSVTVSSGAVKVISSGAIFVSCTFCNNSVTRAPEQTTWQERAGAVYINQSASFSNCVFSNNFAGWRGGAVNVNGCPAEFVSCYFTKNSAGVHGDAITIVGGNVTLDHCEFYLNARGTSVISFEGAPSLFTLRNTKIVDTKPIFCEYTGTISICVQDSIIGTIALGNETRASKTTIYIQGENYLYGVNNYPTTCILTGSTVNNNGTITNNGICHIHFNSSNITYQNNSTYSHAANTNTLPLSGSIVVEANSCYITRVDNKVAQVPKGTYSTVGKNAELDCGGQIFTLGGIASNCTFHNASSTDAAKGAINVTTPSTMVDCVVSNFGGTYFTGITAYNTTLIVSRCYISGHSGNNRGIITARGGATVTVIGTTVTKCKNAYDLVYGSGGGIMSAVDCVFSSNSASGDMIVGGHINASCYMSNCTVTYNYAGYGNVHAAQNTSMHVIGCTIDHNSASYAGGLGMNWAGAKMYISNCTVTNNTAGWGAGFGITTSATNTEVHIYNTNFGSGQTIDIRSPSNTFYIEGSNTFKAQITGSAAIKVTKDRSVSVGQGAPTFTGNIIDLTGNPVQNAIVTTSNIVISSGGTMIIKDSNGSIREFSDVEISATTITNLGVIYGAIVKIPASTQGYKLTTTTGSATVGGNNVASTYTVTGGLVSASKV